MLSIILSACLISNPSHCRDFKIPLDINVDALRCAMAAPPHFAKWAEEHPKWRVKRWKCQPSSLDET